MRNSDRSKSGEEGVDLDLESVGDGDVALDEGEEQQEQVVPRRGRSKLPAGPAGAKRGRGRKSADDGVISIPELKLAHVEMTVVGKKPLVVNHFSHKSKQQMYEKQIGKARDKKAPKVPTEDFLGSLYPMPGTDPKLKMIKGKPPLTVQAGDLFYTDETKKTYVMAQGRFGFPASSFRLAAVSACRYVEGLPMTKALGAFHIEEDLLEILDRKGKPNQPFMRDDVVRLNSGPRPVADLRYRAMFIDWQVRMTITFNERVITPSQIAHLLNIAGFSVGVGEWRPEKRGSFGRFEVA